MFQALFEVFFNHTTFVWSKSHISSIQEKKSLNHFGVSAIKEVEGGGGSDVILQSKVLAR